MRFLRSHFRADRIPTPDEIAVRIALEVWRETGAVPVAHIVDDSTDDDLGIEATNVFQFQTRPAA